MTILNLANRKYFNYQQGFTLLEVMVALAILAVVAVSASQASRSYLQSVDNVKIRTLAYYVAQNTLADLRIQNIWLTSADTRQVTSQNRNWQVVITPQTDGNQGSNQSNGFTQPINIKVAPVIDGATKKAILDIDAVLLKPMVANP